jgi:hypothetical protein
MFFIQLPMRLEDLIEQHTILSPFLILIWLVWRASLHDGINSFQEISMWCDVSVRRFSLALTIKSINSLLNLTQWKIFLLLSIILNCIRCHFETLKTKSFIIVWQVCLAIFLIDCEKNFFSFFPNIEGDVNLQNLLSKQITHLHIDVSTKSKGNSETASNTFALVLSLCERFMELDLIEGFFRKERRKPSVFLIDNNTFLSSTLTKLKINVATLFDCLILLDGRLDSLSTLIINVAYTLIQRRILVTT